MSEIAPSFRRFPTHSSLSELHSYNVSGICLTNLCLMWNLLLSMALNICSDVPWIRKNSPVKLTIRRVSGWPIWASNHQHLKNCLDVCRPCWFDAEHRISRASFVGLVTLPRLVTSFTCCITTTAFFSFFSRRIQMSSRYHSEWHSDWGLAMWSQWVASFWIYHSLEHQLFSLFIADERLLYCFDIVRVIHSFCALSMSGHTAKAKA